MSVLIHAEVHGLAGRAGELRAVLAEHAGSLSRADGCLGAVAAERLDGDATAEFLLEALWRDEEALRTHYRTAEYARYMQQVGELLARPSDVTVHHVDRSYRATADLSADPTRQG
jgi:quinol monooxygenase YgiN